MKRFISYDINSNNIFTCILLLIIYYNTELNRNLYIHDVKHVQFLKYITTET